MSRELRQFTATIPINTPAAAPVTVAMTMPTRVVSRVEIIVPPGSSGLLGWALLNSGKRVIPFDSDLWIITAGEKIVWDLTDYVDSGAWSLLGYNTDPLYPHSVYVRFLADPTTGPGAPLPVYIPENALAGGVLGG